MYLLQLELQEIPLHKGLEQKDAQIILHLIRDQIEAPWEGSHTCNDNTEGSQCIFCEMCAIFFQLSLSLIEYFSPVMELTMADVRFTYMIIFNFFNYIFII